MSVKDESSFGDVRESLFGWGVRLEWSTVS